MSEDRLGNRNALKQDKKNVDFTLNGKMLILPNNLMAVRATNVILIK
jgi:hypothetical protein